MVLNRVIFENGIKLLSNLIISLVNLIMAYYIVFIIILNDRALANFYDISYAINFTYPK